MPSRTMSVLAGIGLRMDRYRAGTDALRTVPASRDSSAVGVVRAEKPVRKALQPRAARIAPEAINPTTIPTENAPVLFMRSMRLRGEFPRAQCPEYPKETPTCIR